ncbi:unnamed protein product [Rodentolepis nana]|uniref:FHA domain-containing protein n=1 Tax=Rodentolepis nana TaxID=102285 RepID=A0A0R3T8R7_RODNA|nr:unnamed protein product [Rodentolepis nana]
MPKLILYQVADVTQEGGNKFRKIEMKDEQDLLLLGRMERNKQFYKQIDSFEAKKAISRLHALIEKADGKFYLSDLSKSGTYVNHRRVNKRTQLKPHDLVYFGHPKGAEIIPDQPITQYFWDLKYVVSIA